MHKIDSSFRKARQARRSRQRWRLAAQLGLLVVVLGGVGGGIFYAVSTGLVTLRSDGAAPPADTLASADDLDATLTEIPAFQPAFVDLAGDPMRISFGDLGGASGQTRAVPRPPDFPADRGAPSITVLTDTMVSSSQRLMVTLPSSPEDFALYQARRSAPQSAGLVQQVSLSPAATGDTTVDDGGGWGETLAGDIAALPEVAPTRIEDTTSLAWVSPEASRVVGSEDVVVRVLVERSMASLMKESGFAEADAIAADAALASLLQRTTLVPGDLVAMRGQRKAGRSGPMSLVQLSLYEGTGYVGTLALQDTGGFGMGVDPWVDQNLIDQTGELGAEAPAQQYRLLDAVYSTAARNGVSTGIIGEAIMLLTRAFDLNAFVDPMDQLILVYGDDGTASDLGRILYVAITGPGRHIECFVYRPSGSDSYSCFDPQSQSATGGGAASGMFTPVSGVLTSGFGPRMHPIFKQVRVHKGVDWAAPTGTPIMAAFAGTVVAAGDGGGYGNLVRISHPNGTETRYAHMSRFADGLTVGQQVAAGTLIGYVGTTGNSTGPHLHFELYRSGEAIDPLGSGAVAVAGGGAVNALVDRIVQVESDGDARAQNTRSSASGAGQFISATWLRMIRKYRPDLAASLTEAEILDLRFDPTIAREMVGELAREGDAYLKSRGLEVTPGRLYLAHFLGMEGAYRVLTADAALPLVDLVGQGVIDANPTMAGRSVGYVITWADDKMKNVGGGGARPPSRPVVATDPAFDTYRNAVRALIAPESTAGIDSGMPHGDIAALALE